MHPERKGLFYLVSLLILIVLLIPVLRFWGPAGSSKPELYIDLQDYPVYLKNGFDPDDTDNLPDPASRDWIMKDQSKPGAIKIKESGLKGLPKHRFLSPFRERDQEFTLKMPFALDGETLDLIQKNDIIKPAIFFAGIGDNWEIFVNGVLVRSELYLDDEGQILSHRSHHHVSFTVGKSIFRSGINIVTARIVGDPNYKNTGLFIQSPYYIGDMASISYGNDETAVIALCGIYIFLGAYHFLLFIMRRDKKYNLYYCIFSILLGIYFLLRSHTIFRFIVDTNILLRLDMGVIFMVIPFIAAFAEELNFKRILLQTKICGGLFFVMVLLEASFSLEFGEDILIIWQILAIFEAFFVFGHDFLYVFYIHARARWKERNEAGKKTSILKALGLTIIYSPIGNLMIGIFILLLTGIFDIVNAMVIHNNLSFSRYGFFIFTIDIAFVLAREFGDVYNKLNKANAALEQSNINLEVIVKERTKELEIQTRVAESASRAKSEFLARMSHEIRTPLNAIIGLAEVELQKSPQGETGDNLEEMHISGSILLALINDLLDISKIESGRLELSPVEYNLLLLLRDCINLNIVRIGSKPISFEIDIDEGLPRFLYGDETRVKQIINNLLSNAFKYTEKGTVTLRVTGEWEGQDIRLNILVEDTGRGIREENLNQLFTEYQRIDAQTNQGIEGTGLGLSIAKKLVEMMDGQISATSVYGKGSTFKALNIRQKITNPEALGKDAASSLQDPDFRKQVREKSRDMVFVQMPDVSVLVVDDVLTNLKVAQGLLRSYGMNVVMAKSGSQAIKIISESETKFDAIFMDHMMPEMDGIEAVKIIRNKIEKEYLKTVPIIALTANALLGNEKMFLENGFQDFLPKPINTARLDEILHKWVVGKN